MPAGGCGFLAGLAGGFETLPLRGDVLFDFRLFWVWHAGGRLSAPTFGYGFCWGWPGDHDECKQSRVCLYGEMGGWSRRERRGFGKRARQAWPLQLDILFLRHTPNQVTS